MRIWLSKSSEVPVREQLATQIVLGVISQDLKPNQKLPSTRELAHRLHIHSNTVSAAYRDLARRGWVEFRRGSGVYVRALTTDSLNDTKLGLDQLISTFVQIARGCGFTLSEIKNRVQRWLEYRPADRFLVIDPDPELRAILVAEIEEATAFPAVGAGFDECANPEVLAGAAPVALYGQAERVRALLPRDTSCLFVRLRSVPASLQSRKPPPSDALITVVSRCDDFLRWSRTILVAAGLDPDAMSFRNAGEPDWQKGLRSSAVLITDTLTAKRLPRDCDPAVFCLIADSSLEELRGYKEFLTRPQSNA